MTRVRARRPTDRARDGAQADGCDNGSCRCGDLQLAGDREAASRDDDREARLLERRLPHETRRRVRGGRIRAAPRAPDEMVLEADLVELRELPVERRREQRSHAIAGRKWNLPHKLVHVSSDGLT